MFNNLVSKCTVAFCETNGQNKICRFDTEGFLPVVSLCGVVGSPFQFTECLIGITGNILSVVYINVKYIYLSETRAFTIIECTIVRIFCHVTST